MNTIKYLADKSINKLSKLYNDQEAKSLTYLLIENYLGIKKHNIPICLNNRLTESEMLKVIRAYRKLASGIPIQHVLGRTEFYGLNIEVNKHTLIPRPETEELIYLVKNNHNNFKKILDIGTGSGCIALSLKKEFKDSMVHAIDFSQEALSVARKNAINNSLEISFLEMDILKENPPERYDLIISNPPYIRPSEKSEMHINVLNHEPDSALFIPEEDPLLFYRRIVQISEFKLTNQGYLYFEINEAFGNETADLFDKNTWSNITIAKDFLGKDRFVFAQLIVDKNDY